MILRIFSKLKNIQARLGIFGSILGSASALTILLLLFGTPATAHASWFGDLISDIGDASLGAMFEGLSYIILMFSNLILYLVGVLFNYVVLNTVFDFGKFFGATNGMIAAWTILRDIANIGLLFGFIFMGIATILDIHGYEVKKTLPRLIIFAILLNFSLLASQLVVDTSNVFASVLYSQAGSTCTANGNVDDTTQACANQGISGKILTASGLNSIFKVGAPASTTDQSVSHTTWGMAYLAMAIFVMITAVVLLAGGLLLITRAIVLAFLMILSPIGFAGLAIPPLERYAKMWWDKLLSQAFFAPVYLLLIFISLKVMEGVNVTLGASAQTSFVDAIAHSKSGSIGILLVFAIFIGFMIASLMAAKQMGALGASFAANSASALVFGSVTRATNLVTGGAGYAGRQIVQRTRLGNTAVGRALVNYGFRPLEKANVDTRRLPGMNGLLGAAGITTGAKPAEHATFGDMKHQVQDIKEGKLDRELNQQYDAERRRQQLETNAHNGALTPNDAAYLTSLSTKDLEALHGIKAGVDTLAENLTTDQFANLMKSDKLTDGEKTQLRNARFAKLGNAINAGNATEVKRWSIKDISQSGFAGDARLADLVSDTQYDDLMKSGDVTNAQKQVLRSGRRARFNPGRASATLAGMSAEAISKLDSDILEQAHIYQEINDTDAWEKIHRAGKLTDTQRTNIGNHIRGLYVTPGPHQTEFKAYIDADPRVKAYWKIP